MIELLAIIIVVGLIVAIWLFLRPASASSVNEIIPDRTILKITVPRHNEKSPVAAEQLYASLHGMIANKKISQHHFSFEIASGQYGIHFIVVVNSTYKTFIEKQFYGQYPEAQIAEISDYSETFDNQHAYAIQEIGLAKESYLPIRTFESFEVDPLASVTSAMSIKSPDQEAFLQIVCRPVDNGWQEEGKSYVSERKNKTNAEGEKVELETGESSIFSTIERKSTKLGFQFKLRLVVKAQDQRRADQLLQEIMASFGQYKTGVTNSLGNRPGMSGWEKLKANIKAWWAGVIGNLTLGEKLSTIERFKLRFLSETNNHIINTEELASLYHLPNKSVETPSISWTRSRKLEPPGNLPFNTGRILGVTDYRSSHIQFGIKPLDRLRHIYMIGKTGMGKSTFIEGLIAADIHDGEGLAFIDPHGDSINEILNMIPPERQDDVVLFDPGDADYPMGLNLLAIKEGDNVSLIADGIVSVFKKAFSHSWGPRLEYILTNTIITLLNCDNVSMLSIPRILSDPSYRGFLLRQIDDPVLLKFWNEEYSHLSKTAKDTMDNIGSILNKIGRFTTNPLIRNIIGQVDSTIQFEEIINNRKILLINLAQGRIGEENMALLGGMLITRLYSATVRRVDMDKTQRTPFYLYVDEFQNFATSTFVKILSEARKFGLGLTFAHQYIEQIEDDIQNAIFGNVGTIMNFAVGPQDAEVLVKQYTPHVTSEDIVNLGKFSLITKLSIDAAQSEPFTAMTLPPQFPNLGMRDQITSASQHKYGMPKEKIEKQIYQWSAQIYTDKGEIYVPPSLRKDSYQKASQIESETKQQPKQRNTKDKRSAPQSSSGPKQEPANNKSSPKAKSKSQKSNSRKSNRHTKEKVKQQHKQSSSKQSQSKPKPKKNKDPLPPAKNKQ